MVRLNLHRVSVHESREVKKIDGRAKACVTIIMCVVICCFLMFSSCGGDGNTGIEDMRGLAGIGPAGTATLMHFDVEKFRQDGDLKNIYESMAGGPNLAVGLDFDIEDIRHYGLIVADFEMTTLISGNLDFDAIRQQLESTDYTGDTYMNTEIWLGSYRAVAIAGDILIIGLEDNVKGSIEIIEAEGTSIYDDNEDFRDVIEKLPSGIITSITGTSYYSGGLVMGYSLRKVDADTLEMNGLVKFTDEDAAIKAMPGLRGELNDGDMFSGIELSHDNEYLKFSARLAIENAENLF
jgi:hypothetical protein